MINLIASAADARTIVEQRVLLVICGRAAALAFGLRLVLRLVTHVQEDAVPENEFSISDLIHHWLCETHLGGTYERGERESPLVITPFFVETIHHGVSVEKV